MIANPRRLVPILLALALPPMSSHAEVAADSVAQATWAVYVNPAFRWSVSYPADWVVDSTSAASTRIRSADSQCLCGIHSGEVPYKDTDRFTKSMLDFMKNMAHGDGLRLVVRSRNRLTLSGGVVANDVLTEIQPGGKSRKVFVMARGTGFMVDCETYAAKWSESESKFDALIRSFALNLSD